MHILINYLKTQNCFKSNLKEFQACQVDIINIYLISLNMSKYLKSYSIQKVLQNYSLFIFVCYIDTNISDTCTTNKYLLWYESVVINIYCNNVNSHKFIRNKQLYEKC